MTVVGHFKSCSLYYPGRNECKVGQNNLYLYFFYWLVFVYHEHEPSGIFLTGVQLHILLVNLLLATIRCLNFAKEENVGYPINFKNPTWIKCHNCYKFRRHRFLLGVACSYSDRFRLQWLHFTRLRFLLFGLLTGGLSLLLLPNIRQSSVMMKTVTDELIPI